jgi:hypothetical protein
MNLLIDTHVLLWWLDDHPTPACPCTFTGTHRAGGAGPNTILPACPGTFTGSYGAGKGSSIFSNIIGIEFYF